MLRVALSLTDIARAKTLFTSASVNPASELLLK